MAIRLAAKMRDTSMAFKPQIPSYDKLTLRAAAKCSHLLPEPYFANEMHDSKSFLRSF